jgi:RNA polymerase sigma-70 factor (ECF subfamily)
LEPTARPERGPEDDQRLVRRVLNGDEAALGTLYDRYGGLVYSVANRILRDTGAAEEVLQDIFHQLWRTASNFDSARGSLSGWLLVMARNRSIDHLRRRSHDPEDRPAESLVAHSPDLESVTEQNEMLARVRTAMDALPAAQRQAMELAYFEGLTQSEIAGRTGDPLGTVKTRMRAALAALKMALG